MVASAALVDLPFPCLEQVIRANGTYINFAATQTMSNRGWGIDFKRKMKRQSDGRRVVAFG